MLHIYRTLHKPIRVFTSILPLFLIFLISGCSTINLERAKELAISGSNTSFEISKSYNKRDSDLELYLEGEYILSALKKGYSIPNKSLLTSVDEVTTEMNAREEIFNALLEVYETFAELATYENSQKIESSINDLTSAVNQYSTLTKNKIYFTKPQEDLAAIIGSQLFKSYHKLKVKKASELIRLRLTAIKSLLEKQSEKKSLNIVEFEIDRNRLKLAIALWNEGLGLPTQIIANHIESYGLQVNQQKTITQIKLATKGKMQIAITNVLRFRYNRQLKTKKAAYNATILAIQALITAHKQFEHGEDFSLESLKNFLKTINKYADLANKMKTETAEKRDDRNP